MIKGDIAVLEKGKPKSKDKREKILMIFKNLKSVFAGACLDYENVSKTEPESEETTAERVKLKRQESAEQPGKRLKILTPTQMLIRLPISLAQLKAGNNSEKLKNEIRQLLYYLHTSKKTYITNLQKFDWHYLKHGKKFYEQ